MKVLQLIESGGPGGAEKCVLHLAKGLAEIGVDNAVATFRTGWLTETLSTEKIQRFQIATKRGRDPLLPLRIAKMAKRFGADVLHTHLLDSAFYGALARIFGGPRVIATEHGDVHHIQGKKFLQIKLRTISLFADRICSVSAFTRSRLTELGVPEGKTAIRHNPVPFTAPNPAARKELRGSLGLSDDCCEDWLWVHAANLRPVKDQATLIRAFAESLSGGLPRQTLCILGDGPLRHELEHLAVTVRAAERIHFFGFREDVTAWLAAADGFVLSSLSESMPISLLEALLSGLPVVSTDVGGVAEIVSKGPGGTLVAPADPAALGQALRSMCSGGTNAREDALQLAERFRPLLSPKAVAESYLELYREALAR